MKWYMVTTADEFELPIAIFPRVKKASDFLGYTDQSSIFSAINNHRTVAKKYKIERVEIEE